MNSNADEQATSADTVTVMVGSFLNMGEMVPSGVVPGLVANGGIGLDAIDDTMADATYNGSYQNDLVTQLAAAWNGSGSGTQEMSEYSGLSSGALALTNTTNAVIEVPAAGALFTAADGAVYQTQEAPTNAAWSNGTAQTGAGVYAILPGATVTVPIEATFQGDDPGSDAPGSIGSGPVAGLLVSQPSPLAPGGNYADPAGNDQGGWLTTAFGNYSFVFTEQGLAPAEGHVNVNAGIAWSSADVASWDGYVASARSVGILNVAPLESGNVALEDPTQPFATSAFYAGIRAAALYGGGLEIELSPWYWFHVSPSEQQTVLEQIRWCTDQGLRSSILVNSQEDYAGDPDPNFAADTTAMLRQLAGEDALPSQVVIENDNGNGNGSFYDANPADPNSLNAVALDVAQGFTLTPTASEAGLEVRGTSTAQTTLIMTGVAPSEDAASGNLAPYGSAQVFSEQPAAPVTVSVTDTTGQLALTDSLDGASTGAGGTLQFTGTPAGATAFLQALTASDPAGSIGVANLALQLTDATGQTTEGTTAVFLGEVHPTITAVTEACTVPGTVHAGDTVVFTLATSAAVTVAGAPTLALTNEAVATYAGQDKAGDLLFSYTVQAGDDTEALRVRGLRLNGGTITDGHGLAVDPDSIDAPEAAMANPLAVGTKTGTITGVTESGGGLLGAGGTVLFTLTANQPIATVSGTPTLLLNDGGTARFAGITTGGALTFTYAVPSGGAFAGLAPSSSYLNGASLTDDLGEPVVPPYFLPAPATTVSYNAADTSALADTLVVSLSADEFDGDAEALITVNGVPRGGAIDVAASHAAGQTQQVVIPGQFSAGTDTLGIVFLNDLDVGGAGGGDRNLYVDGVTLNSVSELDPTELPSTSTLLTPLGAVPPDQLEIWVNEDAAAGNAMFSVAVDGQTLPGIYSTSMSHASGQWQEVDIGGSWGPGPHTVTATFLNNAWSGTTDRLLFVEQIGINGSVTKTADQALLATGSSTTVIIPAAATDVLTLDVSEDAWQGDAQCYVTIDGKPFGGITTVTASHAAGAEQVITINEAGLSVGAHSIGLAFINDAYGGSPSADRNLYLDAVHLNGVNQAVSAALMQAGTAMFEVGPAARSGVTIAGSGSLLAGFATTIVPGIHTAPGAAHLPTLSAIGS